MPPFPIFAKKHFFTRLVALLHTSKPKSHVLSDYLPYLKNHLQVYNTQLRGFAFKREEAK